MRQNRIAISDGSAETHRKKRKEQREEGRKEDKKTAPPPTKLLTWSSHLGKIHEFMHAGA